MVFKDLCNLVLWKKVASVFEGLTMVFTQTDKGRKEFVFTLLTTAKVISQRDSNSEPGSKIPIFSQIVPRDLLVLWILNNPFRFPSLQFVQVLISSIN